MYYGDMSLAQLGNGWQSNDGTGYGTNGYGMGGWGGWGNGGMTYDATNGYGAAGANNNGYGMGQGWMSNDGTGYGAQAYGSGGGDGWQSQYPATGGGTGLGKGWQSNDTTDTTQGAAATGNAGAPPATPYAPNVGIQGQPGIDLNAQGVQGVGSPMQGGPGSGMGTPVFGGPQAAAVPMGQAWTGVQGWGGAIPAGWNVPANQGGSVAGWGGQVGGGAIPAGWNVPPPQSGRWGG